jgi:hypothetical protein
LRLCQSPCIDRQQKKPDRSCRFACATPVKATMMRMTAMTAASATPIQVSMVS